MTLKNNRTPLLCYIKFCASFRSHRWIKTGVTVRKRSNRVKIGNFLLCVTLKFDGWHWITTGHLFHATSSLVYNFIAIGEFKLELQSGNSQFGAKLAIFFIIIHRWEHTHTVKKVWQTDGRTDGLNHSYSCLVTAKKMRLHLDITGGGI